MLLCFSNSVKSVDVKRFNESSGIVQPIVSAICFFTSVTSILLLSKTRNLLDVLSIFKLQFGCQTLQELPP
jgi:hypothetical protein